MISKVYTRALGQVRSEVDEFEMSGNSIVILQICTLYKPWFKAHT